MAESGSEKSPAHQKLKIAGEIALALGIVAGGVAGMQIKKHRTPRERRMQQLGQDYDSAALPPLTERISIFALQPETNEPDMTTEVAAFLYINARDNGNKATAGTIILESVALPELSIGAILTNLSTYGFIDVEAAERTSRNSGELSDEPPLITATADLMNAESLSYPLQMAISNRELGYR